MDEEKEEEVQQTGLDSLNAANGIMSSIQTDGANETGVGDGGDGGCCGCCDCCCDCDCCGDGNCCDGNIFESCCCIFNCLGGLFS